MHTTSLLARSRRRTSAGLSFALALALAAGVGLPIVAYDSPASAAVPAPTRTPRPGVGEGTVSVDAESYQPAGRVTVKGSGFVAGNQLSLKINDGAVRNADGEDVVATADVGADGTFTVTVDIAPFDLGEGTHWFRILGSQPQVSKFVTFAVSTTPAPAPTTAVPAPTTPAPAPTTAVPSAPSAPAPGNDPVDIAQCRQSPTYVEVSSTWPSGQRVTVTGHGWRATDGGGSMIAFKLDGKAVLRTYDLPAGTVARAQEDRSVWAVTEADAQGSFSVTFDLPDGTNATDPKGAPVTWSNDGTAHTLTLLTGSLKDGDASRSVIIRNIQVGDAGAAPTPGCYVQEVYKQPAYDDLSADNAQGLIAQVDDHNISVALSDATDVGAVVRVLGFDAEGNVRLVQADKEAWKPVDANRHVTFRADAAQYPSGIWYLAAVGGKGQVLGWTAITAATGGGGGGTVVNNTYTNVTRVNSSTTTSTSTHSSTHNTTVIRRSSAPVVRPAAAPQINTDKPAGKPGTPISDVSELTEDNAGGITAEIEDDILTITVPDSIPPGTWVSLTVYPGEISGGWAQVDTHGRLKVQVSGLEPGDYQIVLGDRENNLLGWAGFTIEGTATAPSAAAPDRPAPRTTIITPQTVDNPLLSADDWLLVAAAVVLAVGSGVIALIVRKTNSGRVIDRPTPSR